MARCVGDKNALVSIHKGLLFPGKPLMIEERTTSLSLWSFKNLSKFREISHFVSSRIGGCSTPPYASLNLSFNVGDDPQKVLKNRQRLAEAIGNPLSNLTTAKQIHDCRVTVVSEPLRGNGATDYSGAIDATDAMVTRVPEICLMILLADCVPMILYDPIKRVVGVTHAGWRGTLQAIAQKTVRVFQRDFGTSPQDMVAAIGPSIGPCCYEVGPSVLSQIEHLWGTSKGYVRKESSGDKEHFDLWEANRRQLMRAGIPTGNIEIAKICTHHHPDLFFSYRHAKGKTGRFGAGIFLRP